ncbi:hypothetical protein I4F81_000233 [Pyropia yezoensis]|uniref:Uncharacterized protein n=1 Tax=Pyropia yezoensis TaxID=2788 RepID=A0ACC3BIK8_PYRYE|nr:hypothetical protein I4F81_000233 [Neopyropia yezoensis]
MAAALPPRNIGGTTKALKAALQAALQARLSRVVVELPAGARYGVEKAAADGSDDPSARGGGAAAPTAATAAVSDRELARLVVAMFAGNGLGIVALFRDGPAAAAAAKAWGGGAASDCRITSWDALARLARLADDAGPGTVLVILNGRLDIVPHPSPALRDHFTGATSPWTRVLLFRPGPHPGWAGGVLYRQFPDPYVLCRKARLGPPVRLAEFPDQPPSLDEMDAALRAASDAEGSTVCAYLYTT